MRARARGIERVRIARQARLSVLRRQDGQPATRLTHEAAGQFEPAARGRPTGASVVGPRLLLLPPLTPSCPPQRPLCGCLSRLLLVPLNRRLQCAVGHQAGIA